MSELKLRPPKRLPQTVPYVGCSLRARRGSCLPQFDRWGIADMPLFPYHLRHV
jgi:hypothetical protein